MRYTTSRDELHSRDTKWYDRKFAERETFF